ncbi:MAG: alkaline phosphatase [Deltaproteobacteria bacterium]|nr:alkaline phosphatase [Deltaproteobacteria bacterium]
MLRRIAVALAVALVAPACSSSGNAAPPAEAPAPVAPKPAAPPAAPVAKPEPRVVVVSVDGLRADLITPEVMPRHAKLAAEGATARSASTIPETDTLPSHAAMLSGVGAAAHGLTWNSYRKDRGPIRVPTVFSAAHDRKLATAMFVGKAKLRHLLLPGSVDHFEIPRDPTCAGVAAAAAAHFASARPHLMFVHFSDPDDAGHRSGWLSPDYLAAAKASDRCLGTLLDAIDATPMAASTLVIVTADHGGDGHSHSDGRSQLNRRIPWIARGAGFARASTIDAPVDTRDTAATVLAALGLPALPNMLGTSRLPVR